MDYEEYEKDDFLIITTKRLILRPLTIADAETAYYGWTGDADVARYVSQGPILEGE